MVSLESTVMEIIGKYIPIDTLSRKYGRKRILRSADSHDTAYNAWFGDNKDILELTEEEDKKCKKGIGQNGKEKNYTNLHRYILAISLSKNIEKRNMVLRRILNLEGYSQQAAKDVADKLYNGEFKDSWVDIQNKIVKKEYPDRLENLLKKDYNKRGRLKSMKVEPELGSGSYTRKTKKFKSHLSGGVVDLKDFKLFQGRIDYISPDIRFTSHIDIEIMLGVKENSLYVNGSKCLIKGFFLAPKQGKVLLQTDNDRYYDICQTKIKDNNGKYSLVLNDNPEPFPDKYLKDIVSLGKMLVNGKVCENTFFALRQQKENGGYSPVYIASIGIISTAQIDGKEHYVKRPHSLF